MGDQLKNVLRRGVGAAALVLLLAASACRAEPRQPDLSTREEFARSVMAAAVSGSVERVEGLVDPVFSNARPEAEQLVDSTRGWTPGSWQLYLSNDFPEMANVTASQNGQAPTVHYAISWSHERWTLVMGEPKNPPSGSAKPIGPGAKPTGPSADPKVVAGASSVPATSTSTSTPAPAACPTRLAGAGVSPVPAYGAVALTCRTFTSTSGYARGRNMYWLTAAPLHLGFDRMNGALTMVVRMPCGVLNVPVAVDDFGLVPDPARMAESADGCAGPDAEHRSWTSAYFKEAVVYHLDSSELVLTSQLGQIRFKQD
ncbi:MAG: hypothetical protein NTU93_14930 [Arthrobacter sp.]|nr:hypothetical protein [Arthrobacter sp.]